LFLVNPNGKFDPTTQLALNPKTWVEPPYGTFGSSAAYFNDYRWQRQPSENMSFGRIFRFNERATIPRGIREHLQPFDLLRAHHCWCDDHYLAHRPFEPRRHFILRLRLC
jgi:hypothetical protein